MSEYFSSKAISAVLIAVTLLLVGCSAREPKVIAPPKDAAAVIEPFLKELAAGNKDKAAAFVSTAATDELATQFAEDHKRLAIAGKLTPRFVTQSGNDLRRLAENSGGDGSEVTVVYAVKSGGKWTSATVRVYKYRDDLFKVEYWRINNEEPQQALPSGIDSKTVKRTEKMMAWSMGGLALLGLLGIIGLIWVIRRKPHLVVPEEAVERRQSATTLRDD
jgi:hypothetical protein